MKCSADIVTACDNLQECKCGFCKEHCICDYLQSLNNKEDIKEVLNDF